MEKSITIKVVYDEVKKDIIKVTDDAGNAVDGKSVLVILGDFEGQGFYSFTAGCAADLGWALAKFWRFCRLSTRPHEAHGRCMFHHMIKWIATYFGWTTNELTDPDELLKRWDAEDKEQAEAEAKMVKYLM